MLLELLQRLDAAPAEVLAAPDMLPLAWQVQALAQDRVLGVSVAQTQPLDPAAVQAPFADKGHCAGPQAFSCLKIQTL